MMKLDFFFSIRLYQLDSKLGDEGGVAGGLGLGHISPAELSDWVNRRNIPAASRQIQKSPQQSPHANQIPIHYHKRGFTLQRSVTSTHTADPITSNGTKSTRYYALDK